MNGQGRKASGAYLGWQARAPLATRALAPTGTEDDGLGVDGDGAAGLSPAGPGSLRSGFGSRSCKLLLASEDASKHKAVV